MTSIKFLLAIIFIACCLVQYHYAATCTSSATSTTCSIPVTFYDHAPAWMTHSRWPADWWVVSQFYDFPANGSSGTANNTYGWSNSDFELPLPVLQNALCCSPTQKALPIIQGETGLVGRLCTSAIGSDVGCGTLASDRTPIYAYPGASRTGQVSSPESFYTFFHNVEQTFQVPSNITLIESSTKAGERTFTNMSFFPLDGLGWNDWQSNFDNTGRFQKHNYGFCMVMNTYFTYSGGEYFHFLGDDDVYAYINGYLIMDLGGVHTAQNASIYTDGLGLVVNDSYRFDFFYCERHSTSSEISFSTTISFFCPYVDWCGQCSGSGQSCCGDLCDDHNPCTVDTCGLYTGASGCNHTYITCPPSTPCSNSFCDPNSGNCTTTPVNCDDGNNCTVDTCGPAGCSHVQRTDCASSNQCLKTGCDPLSGCFSSPLICTTSDLCMNSSCSPNIGCVTTKLPCSTSNQCQTASCTPSGGCQIIDNPPCNDNNNCTTDTCDPSRGCISTLKNITSMCGVSDQCTQYSCDPQHGCVRTDTICTPSDSCHAAVCIPDSGCRHYANVTCPSDACGNGSCNPNTGACIYTKNPPCPERSCFNSTCDSNLGCVYTPVLCVATQNCTASTCVNDQCVVSNLTGTAGCGTCGFEKFCDVSDPCNPQVCRTSAGVQSCVTQPVICNDYNACTNDTCTVVQGQAHCLHTEIVCNAGDLCHPQSCDPNSGSCVFHNVSCDDSNPCTNDACVISGNSSSCTWTAIECNSSDPFCHPMECQMGVCVNSSLPDCTDGNSCTLDMCTNGACQNPLLCPDSGTVCDPIVCLNGSCVTQPVNCSSGNLCSLDTCDPTTGNCLYTAKECNGTTCAPSACNVTTGFCEVPELMDCNDGNPCTLDQLTCTEDYGFVCNNSDETYVCNSHSACILDFCNSTSTAVNAAKACYHENVTCTAPTICQVVAGCDAKNGCFYAPKVCPAPSDWCQVSICDEVAGCLNVARACAPADNYCYAGFCNNATKSCSQQQRPNWQTITNQNGVTCLLAYNSRIVTGLTSGIIAAIVIAAVVAAALFAAASAKGVQIFMSSRAAPNGAAIISPLYVESAGTGRNALYH